jgi:hypothetical protein
MLHSGNGKAHRLIWLEIRGAAAKLSLTGMNAARL